MFDKTIRLYIHIPFCVRKCAYCDFLSAPADEAVQEAYVESLLREIGAVREPLGRTVTSVFFGGGTPSILRPEWLTKLCETLYRQFQLSPDAEISMEANPGTLSPGALRQLRSAGVNRLSLGLQSPCDEELRVLGRIHDFAAFEQSFYEARAAGFENINVDLMFALPGQTRLQWEKNLRTVAAMRPEHISAYSLIIEEGTPFAAMELDLPDEETEYWMYEDTARVLGEYGYEQYEISNYAKPGKHCRHNLAYWEREDYLGLGLGAASLIGHTRFSNTRDLGTYLRWGKEEKDYRTLSSPPRQDIEILTPRDEMAEYIYLGLRKTAGISPEGFAQTFGASLWDIYGRELDKFLSLSLLQNKNGMISLTREGIHVSNSVFCEFL